LCSGGSRRAAAPTKAISEMSIAELEAMLAAMPDEGKAEGKAVSKAAGH
jgi:hypothetical protein